MKNCMNKKSFGTKATALILTAVLATSMALPAFANDHQDRRYSFIFSRDEDKTEFLAKEDATPVYLKCHSASAPWHAHVLGGNRNAMAYEVGYSHNVTTGTTVFIPITDYKSEWAYGIRGEYTVRDSAAWGYWSPDSV